jgi:hypothetical protein
MSAMWTCHISDFPILHDRFRGLRDRDTLAALCAVDTDVPLFRFDLVGFCPRSNIVRDPFCARRPLPVERSHDPVTGPFMFGLTIRCPPPQLSPRIPRLENRGAVAAPWRAMRHSEPAATQKAGLRAERASGLSYTLGAAGDLINRMATRQPSSILNLA